MVERSHLRGKHCFLKLGIDVSSWLALKTHHPAEPCKHKLTREHGPTCFFSRSRSPRSHLTKSPRSPISKAEQEQGRPSCWRIGMNFSIPNKPIFNSHIPFYSHTQVIVPPINISPHIPKPNQTSVVVQHIHTTQTPISHRPIRSFSRALDPEKRSEKNISDRKEKSKA